MTTITISRHYGSGGRKVAALVREMLGYRFFDKLFMAQIAAEVGLSENEIADFSEEDYKVRTFLERLISFNPSEMVVSPSSAQKMNLAVSSSDVADNIELVKLTVRAAYEKSGVVIVGRGAQVILQNQPQALHIRIVAPVETRLKRLQEIEGLSLQEARNQIERQDKATNEYLERFFGARWDNPYLYHLTINTGYCDIEQAARLIVETVRLSEAARA